ncbi:MAG: methyl-accepting chemotaxis protein [Steroidobacteraceae bacterium]
MSASRNWSLRTRMLGVIVLCVLIGFAITVSALTYQASNMQRDSALQYAQQLAATHSSEVEIELESALNAARGVAQALSGLKSAGLTDRVRADAILKKVLTDNPQLLGVWTGWEPNAFDGKDAEHVNKPGHDATGRYVPYWNRGTGSIALDALTDYDKDGAGDYYQIAKRTGAETILEPYSYKVGGKDVLMTSLAVPIVIDGRVLGIAGVDIALSQLQSSINAIRVYDTGYASLFSAKGAYVSDRDSKKVTQLLGSNEPAEVLAAITQGNSLRRSVFNEALGAQVTQLFTPVHIGAVKSPWSLAINVPEDRMLAGVKQLRNVALLLGAFSIVLVSVGMGWMLNRLVIRPIGGEPEQAALVANRVAQGDLTVHIDVAPGDNGSLMTALRDMQQQLGSIVSNVRDGASQVASASQQIAQGNDDLSRRTQLQAASLEETAASMEEMTSSVKQTADYAAQANRIAISARQLADSGGKVVTDAVAAMNEINGASTRIGEIISVIDEIAFQTNLLALNAAVEAARAGEMGRGFAVVASEVRTLAQRSASAAKETKALINDSVAKVGTGCELVDKTGKVLGEIVDSVKKMTDVVREISSASNEQAAGIEQIGTAIAQLDRTTQENAALVEESAAAAEILSQQSADMVQAASVFKLASDHHGHTASAPLFHQRYEQPVQYDTSAAA